MNAFEADTLNSLIRWVEYAYGAGVQDCVHIEYDLTVQALQNEDWANQTSITARQRKNEKKKCFYNFLI